MISGQKKKVLELFADGRKHYKLMSFAKAKECFAAALEVDSDDGPSKVYWDRCAQYVIDPPPDDWDGVFVMQTK